MSRVGEVPCLARREDQVDACLYNLWRRARARSLLPLRFPLPDSPGVEILVEQNAWVCVNGRQADLPILAWVEFADRGRSALHTPVPCMLNYYHYAASSYRARALAALEAELSRLLGKGCGRKV